MRDPLPDDERLPARQRRAGEVDASEEPPHREPAGATRGGRSRFAEELEAAGAAGRKKTRPSPLEAALAAAADGLEAVPAAPETGKVAAPAATKSGGAQSPVMSWLGGARPQPFRGEPGAAQPDVGLEARKLTTAADAGQGATAPDAAAATTPQPAAADASHAADARGHGAATRGHQAELRALERAAAAAVAKATAETDAGGQGAGGEPGQGAAAGDAATLGGDARTPAAPSGGHPPVWFSAWGTPPHAQPDLAVEPAPRMAAESIGEAAAAAVENIQRAQELAVGPARVTNDTVEVSLGEGADQIALRIVAHHDTVRVEAIAAAAGMASAMSEGTEELRNALARHGLSLTELATSTASNDDTASRGRDAAPQDRDAGGPREPGTGQPRAAERATTIGPRRPFGVRVVI